MSDDEDGAALGNLLHILLDDALALVIERARRFVEDQDPGLVTTRARAIRYPLLLPPDRLDDSLGNSQSSNTVCDGQSVKAGDVLIDETICAATLPRRSSMSLACGPP
jgi:hypothetical protein